MRRIKPLSEALRSSIRSGVLLFDLTRVVEELVFNSLDAGATKVSVFIDIGRCSSKVVDNGTGITRDGLALVGERYATSKFLSLADVDATNESFGFRGEALASISDVSLLEIVTRTYGRANGYCKILKGCKCLYLGIDDNRKDVGTTVVVRDLFYNQPVRRKCMQSSPKKVLQSVKKCIVRLALVHPKISFKVVDIENEEEVLCTKSSSSPLPLIVDGFGDEVARTLFGLEFSSGKLKLSGYISGPCNSFTMKALQYIYINSQFICKGPMHKLLNQLAFRFQNDYGPQKKRSRSQAYPAYILNISCPRNLYDLTFEPSKMVVEFQDWTPILEFLDKTIGQFWEDSTAPGMLECKSQDLNACGDLFSSTSDMLTKEDYQYFLDREHSNTLSYLQRSTAEINERQYKNDLFYMRKCDSHRLHENGVSSAQDYFSDNKFSVSESSEVNAQDGVLNLPLKNNLSEADDVINGSSFSASLFEQCDFSNDVDFSGASPEPLLRKYSIGGSLLQEMPLFEVHGSDYRSDRLTTKQRWGTSHDRNRDSWSQYYPKSRKKSDMSIHSEFLSKAFDRENLLPSKACFSEVQLESSASGHQFLNADRGSAHSHKKSQATSWDNGELEGISKSYDGDHYKKFVADEESECKFDDDIMPRTSILDNCLPSCTNTGFNFDGFAGHRENYYKFLEFPYQDSTCSSVHSEFLGIDVNVSSLDSHSRNYKSMNMYKSKDKFRLPNSAQNHERLRRSFSAPPVYRSKRRFFSLHHPSAMKIRKNDSHTSSHALTCQVVGGESECPQQTSGNDNLHFKQTFTDNFLLETRPMLKTMLGIRTNMENRKLEKAYHSQDDIIQDITLSTDMNTKEDDDSTNFWSKWHKCSPYIPKNDNLLDIQSQSNILDISSGFLHLAGNSLVPEAISKNSLENAKVLPQVDKKFIPVVAGRTLAVIDQHAADERIKLEELRRKVLSGEAKAVTYLDAEKELVLPEIGYQLLQNYSDQIKDWGWICNIHSQDSKSFKRSLNILTGQRMVVTLIAVPCILGVNLTDIDLMEFLQQLADTDGSSSMPPSVVRVLSSKACRGAIMFGDSLLPSECSLIVEELKQTSLCFQCAHGRPTTVPLVDLEGLHNQVAKLGLSKDSLNEEWHGLHRQAVCLERAKIRLHKSTG